MPIHVKQKRSFISKAAFSSEVKELHYNLYFYKWILLAKEHLSSIYSGILIFCVVATATEDSHKISGTSKGDGVEEMEVGIYFSVNRITMWFQAFMFLMSAASLFSIEIDDREMLCTAAEE